MPRGAVPVAAMSGLPDGAARGPFPHRRRRGLAAPNAHRVFGAGATRCGVVRGGDEPRHAASARDALSRRDRGRARRRRGPLRPLFRRPRPGHAAIGGPPLARDLRGERRPAPAAGSRRADRPARRGRRPTSAPRGGRRPPGRPRRALPAGCAAGLGRRRAIDLMASISHVPRARRPRAAPLVPRERQGLAYLLGEGVATYFEDGASSDLGLSRRRSITVRTRFVELVGLDPVRTGSGGRAGVQPPVMASDRPARPRRGARRRLAPPPPSHTH